MSILEDVQKGTATTSTNVSPGLPVGQLPRASKMAEIGLATFDPSNWQFNSCALLPACVLGQKRLELVIFLRGVNGLTGVPPK